MKIATVLNVHTNPSLVLDTIESINKYVTNDVIVIIDGASKEFDNIDLPCSKVEGFRHGCANSPYRNVALGLSILAETYPSADWFLYTEYDCLFNSDQFKLTLQQADEMDVWMMGSDGHVDDKSIPLIDGIINGPT